MAKNKSKKSILMSVIAVIAFVLCVVALTGSAPRIRLSLAGGGKVSNGILTGVEADAHITSVPEGEIRYLINKRIMFENSYSLGSVMLENPESCQYDIKFVCMSHNTLRGAAGGAVLMAELLCAEGYIS